MLLPFSSFQQWCSQWCWAAVSTSIANYFGTPMTDSLGRQWPARECYLASINAGFNDWNTCCQYAACGYQACNQPVAWHNMDDALAAVGLYGRVLQRPLTEPEIQREIANGRPIVVGFQGTGIGHVALITGYTPGTPFVYQLDDPWPHTGMGSTRFQLTYQQILYGPDGQTPWGGSWYRISGRPDGCVQSVNPDCSCQTEEDTNPPPACGDGVCESNESNCPEDCSTSPVCGDGVCEDGEDGCMTDCGSDSDPVCGDGVCEQEEEGVCDLDCTPETICGNGVCEDGEGSACPQDCETESVCSDPNYPVDCGDGVCWSEGTNCESVTFDCGGTKYKCANILDTASCCNDQFYTCGWEYPFFCPSDGRCYAERANCPDTSCSYVNLVCEEFP
jgi:hypothetical protein